MRRAPILLSVILTAAAAGAQAPSGRPAAGRVGVDVLVTPPPDLFDPRRGPLTGVTALHDAAALDADPALIAALARSGANPRDIDGRTPLHVAATPRAAAALLAAGADPCARDASGERALSVAVVAQAPAAERDALVAALLRCR